MARPCDNCGHTSSRKKRKEHECVTCNQADQHCERDAQWDCGYLIGDGNIVPCKPLPDCFCCGMPVCRNCSSKRNYLKYGKQRLCNDCQIEMDGNSRRVMYRTARKAGYDRSASRVIAERGY